MSDTTPGGFADTPGPEATPEQDADVRALLAFLRDEPMEMPPDVVARLDAVIAEERRRASAPAVSAAGGTDSDDAGAERLAPVTVLPAPAERRGPSMTAFKVVAGIAAAALVVVGGVTVLGGLGAGPSRDTAVSSVAGGAAPTAAEAAGGESGTGATRLSASGATYTAASLSTQAGTLAGLSLGRVKAADRDASAPVAPTTATQGSGLDSTAYSILAAPTDASALAAASLTPDKVTTCVRTLTDGDGTVALAVDAGTWAGKPALVVVLPTKDDPASLDVVVVTRDCSPDFLTFARIPRP